MHSVTEEINMRDMLPPTPIVGYDSSSTILGVSKAPNGNHVLMFEATSDTGMLLYMVRLFDLNHNESKLSDGRFKNFKPQLRTNVIVQDYHSHMANTLTYSDLLQKQIEWVANETYNTPQTWGLSIEARHTSLMENHFFFSEEELAIHFKLYWA